MVIGTQITIKQQTRFISGTGVGYWGDQLHIFADGILSFPEPEDPLHRCICVRYRVA
jgi:hypothetical protein